MKLKICSWNILGPELLFYFWRSSYGLSFVDKKSKGVLPHDYYDHVTGMRIGNIIEYLKGGNFDIILLQETSTTKYSIVGGVFVQDDMGLAVHEIIADALGYNIVSESYKTGLFMTGLPPFEQDKNKTVRKSYSGVATLAKPDFVFQNVVSANTCKGKVVSPFTLDALIMAPIGYKGCGNKGPLLYIGNVHVKMNYPHINESIDEIYNCIADVIGDGILCTIIMGDFNAHGIVAAKDLYKSDLSNQMFDLFGSELVDDHIFVGHKLTIYEKEYYIDETLPMLEMGVNDPSVGRRWIMQNTKYNHSAHNQKLIDREKATTDHSPIIVEFDFTSRRNPVGLN